MRVFKVGKFQVFIFNLDDSRIIQMYFSLSFALKYSNFYWFKECISKRDKPAWSAGRLCSFFCFSKKTNQKKEPFTKVFFMLFYRTHKNRLKSAKILPRFQNFLTRFSNYTAVKDSTQRNFIV